MPFVIIVTSVIVIAVLIVIRLVQLSIRYMRYIKCKPQTFPEKSIQKPTRNIMT